MPVSARWPSACEIAIASLARQCEVTAEWVNSKGVFRLPVPSDQGMLSGVLSGQLSWSRQGRVWRVELAKRDNHYEAAFESFLRNTGIPYVAVDEARRAVMADGRSLKSLDFLVAPPGPITWLVDVKGRRFPSGLEHHQYWKNWSTQDDLESLSEWEILFGQGFRGLFVFAFHVIGRRLPLAPEWLVTFRGERYAFLGVELAHYRQMCYLLSPQWQTVAVAARRFREVARPIQTIFSANFPSTAPVVCDPVSDGTMPPVTSTPPQ